jgi:hypothetical protein
MLSSVKKANTKEIAEEQRCNGDIVDGSIELTIPANHYQSYIYGASFASIACVC